MKLCYYKIEVATRKLLFLENLFRDTTLSLGHRIYKHKNQINQNWIDYKYCLYNLSRKNREIRYKSDGMFTDIKITKTTSKSKSKMGAIFANILNSFSNMKSKILMLGLDGAGKTSILYQFKLNESVNSVPTIGFNVE